jgi:hypothetical protein
MTSFSEALKLAVILHQSVEIMRLTLMLPYTSVLSI